MQLKRYAQLILVILTALSVGLQWGVVQVVGWIGMTWEFSQSETLSDALKMTFDGQHPCELCKLVAQEGPLADTDGKQAPEKQSDLKPLTATHWLDENSFYGPSAQPCVWFVYDCDARSTRDRPPVPPPRCPWS